MNDIQSKKSRLIKRDNKAGKAQTHSKLYKPFKAAGHICNQVGFALQKRAKAWFITTSVGSSFHVYDIEKLNVVMVGRQNSDEIAALTCRGEETFVAIKNQIIKYKRTHQVMNMRSPLPGNIYSIEVFGGHIMALTEDNVFQLWDFKTGELYTSIEFQKNGFLLTCLLHPDTYLNKVLFGSSQGSMQLWNVKTRKLIYSFKPFHSPITYLAQSPVIDVIAIGLLDGTIILYNIKLDKKLFSFEQEGRVTCITFRTDSFHHMATSNMEGDIAIWDLEEKRIFHVMKGAHANTINKIQFLNQQPLLISSGSDNSLKQWLFDTHDGLPRLYKSRTGHYEPPTLMHYYYGGNIISAGQDRTLRQISVIKDNRSCEISQGKIESKAKAYDVTIESLKLPPIVDLAIHDAKQRRWDNILTVHLNSNIVYTWNLLRNSIGNHKLIPPNDERPKVVAISHCGNFGLVGTQQGNVHIFNLQSGILRHSTKVEGSNSKPITSILVDDSNRRFATVSLDGLVKIWDFSTVRCENQLDLGVAISKAVTHPGSNMIAAVTDDFMIHIVDLETLKVVRRFQGHQHRITSLAFTPDGRWLVSGSLDSTLRTWDLPSGHLIDIVKLPHVITSLDFSPQGDFLATTHAGQLGVYIWSNQAMYSEVNLKAIPSDINLEAIADLPMARVEEGGEGEEDNQQGDSEDSDDDEETILALYKSPDQITSEMITLTSQPWSKWQKVLHLDTVKERNKPTAPIKKPELAPFFLKTTQGVNPQFVAEESNSMESHITKRTASELTTIESELIKEMRSSLESGDVQKLISMMEALNPPQVALEISLIPITPDFEAMLTVLRTLTLLLRRGVGYEMALVFLNTLLCEHGPVFAENSDVFELELMEVVKVGRERWSELETLFRYVIGLVGFVRTEKL